MREKKYIVKCEAKNESAMFSGITPMSSYIRRKYHVRFNSYKFVNFPEETTIILINKQKEKIVVEHICSKKTEK